MPSFFDCRKGINHAFLYLGLYVFHFFPKRKSCYVAYFSRISYSYVCIYFLVHKTILYKKVISELPIFMVSKSICYIVLMSHLILILQVWNWFVNNNIGKIRRIKIMFTLIWNIKITINDTHSLRKCVIWWVHFG